jgi:hypothetical protein
VVPGRAIVVVGLHGLALDELVARVALPLRRPIPATLLRVWLLREGLAYEVNGELRPTPRCVRLGSAL